MLMSWSDIIMSVKFTPNGRAGHMYMHRQTHKHRPTQIELSTYMLMNYVHMYSGPKAQSFLFSAPLFSRTNGAEKRTNGTEKRTNGAEKRTNGAEKRTNGAEKRTNGAEKRTNGAEKRTHGAEKRTNGAEKRTNGAEKRKCTLGPPYIWSNLTKSLIFVVLSVTR